MRNSSFKIRSMGSGHPRRRVKRKTYLARKQFAYTGEKN
jgi:hypothetical protein